jgi:hypothetical protein
MLSVQSRQHPQNYLRSSHARPARQADASPRRRALWCAAVIARSIRIIVAHPRRVGRHLAEGTLLPPTAAACAAVAVGGLGCRPLVGAPRRRCACICHGAIGAVGPSPQPRLEPLLRRGARACAGRRRCVRLRAPARCDALIAAGPLAGERPALALRLRRQRAAHAGSALHRARASSPPACNAAAQRERLLGLWLLRWRVPQVTQSSPGAAAHGGLPWTS